MHSKVIAKQNTLIAKLRRIISQKIKNIIGSVAQNYKQNYALCITIIIR